MTKQEQQQGDAYRVALAREKAQNERMKKEAEIVGVKAAYWKGQVEVMKYSMEYEALMPEYMLHQERMKAKDAELEEKKRQAIQDMNDLLAKEQEAKEALPNELEVQVNP